MNRTNKEWVKNPDGTQGYTWNPITGWKPDTANFWPKRFLHKSLKRLPYKPCGIFVCDMGELFGDWIPIEWQESIFHSIKILEADRFYLLTKQPQNLIKWSPFPENCYVGVTATDADMAFDAINCLDDVHANVRFLSFEPLLAPINLVHLNVRLKECVDWVIIGAQTKPYKPPRIEWVQEIVQACRQANIPIFLKNNLEPIIENRKLIQEMP